MTLLEATLYFAAAAYAGAVNSVAGGGTFLTFPMLIFGGMSPLSANITSTVALWPGSIAGAYAYRSELNAGLKKLIPLLISGLMGGAVGAIVLLATPERTFEGLVPYLLLTATLIFTFGRRLVPLIRRASRGEPKEERLAGGAVFLFVLSIYGGYFGAGMGILLLAVFQLVGMESIHKMNALKTLLVVPVNGVSVLIFVAAGKVVWPITLVMVAGALTGGYWGARLSLRVKPDYIRYFVSLVGVAMTAYFFIKGA